MEFDSDAVNEEESLFPEVRVSVSNIDDPEMPVLTLRMWFIGLLLCIIAGYVLSSDLPAVHINVPSSMNVFFYFRQPAPSVPPLALVITSYPLGRFLAFILPTTPYRLPRWLGGMKFSLNPGPWNIKEHVLVYIMANVSISIPYALNFIIVAQVDYNFKIDYWFGALFTVATQLTGFGLAGMCRRFLVWPARMVWPTNLVTCTLLNTLHAEDKDDLAGISRYRYFLYVLGGAFFFWFIPGNQSPSPSFFLSHSSPLQATSSRHYRSSLGYVGFFPTTFQSTSSLALAREWVCPS